jgi:hypothetical protein
LRRWCNKGREPWKRKRCKGFATWERRHAATCYFWKDHNPRSNKRGLWRKVLNISQTEKSLAIVLQVALKAPGQAGWPLDPAVWNLKRHVNSFYPTCIMLHVAIAITNTRPKKRRLVHQRSTPVRYYLTPLLIVPGALPRAIRELTQFVI